MNKNKREFCFNEGIMSIKSEVEIKEETVDDEPRIFKEELFVHDNLWFEGQSCQMKDELMDVSVKEEQMDFNRPTNETGVKNLRNPWPYLSPLFEFKCLNGNNAKMICQLCKPKKELSCCISSPSNLQKHIKKCHASVLSKYTELTASRKRRKYKDRSGSSETSNKQTKLDDPLDFTHKKKAITQAKLDEQIIDFVAEGVMPFCIVELKTFQNIIKMAHPNLNLMSSHTLRHRFESSALNIMSKVDNILRSITHVATTTDCWSARGRAYLGITVHWINPTTMKRQWAALACRRLRGSHTFELLADTLDDIHKQFHLTKKILITTTDNGANFVKAFSVFDKDGHESAIMDEDSGELEDVEDEVGSADDDDGQPLEITNELHKLSPATKQHLPPHQRCACHTINLIATRDVDAAEGDASYKNTSRSAFSKCQILWKKVARSVLAVEAVEDICGLALIKPNEARWNSVFNAIQRINRIHRQNEEVLDKLCDKLSLTRFSDMDLEFLQEYEMVMKPVARALDFLQGESKAYMGFFLPTILGTKQRLEELNQNGKRVHGSCFQELDNCKPLTTALLDGFERRFGSLIQDRILVAASLIHPELKADWCLTEEMAEQGKAYLQERILGFDNVEIQTNTTDDDDGDADADAFVIGRKVKKKVGANGSLARFLEEPVSSAESIKEWPQLLPIFLELNTPLPSSAVCERMFSCEGLIFTPRCSRVSDKNFENQLLVKLNSSKF